MKFQYSMIGRVNLAKQGICICILGDTRSYLQFFTGKKMQIGG